jgi:hypothetical protein
MRFFNHRGAFFEDEWLSVVDRGLFRSEVLQFLGNGLVRWLMFRHPRFPVC